MRRRVAFAAPFVVVVACSKPAPEPVEPPMNPPAPQQLDAGVVVDAPMLVDAAVVVTSVSTSPVDQWRPSVRCDEPPQRMCNPPRPGCGMHLGCSPIIARILAVKVEGSDMVVSTSVPAGEQVNPDWLACIVPADSERCVPGGDLDVIEVSGRTVRATLTATDIDIAKHGRVRLVPPPDIGPVGERARIIAVSVVGDDTIATVGAGNAKGVTKGSKICVLDARDTAGTRCLPGGELEVLEVKANVTKARTRLTMEQLKANPRVLIR